MFEYPITTDQVMSTLLYYGVPVITFMIAALIGYILGLVVSKVLQKVLMVGELQKTLVRYGAVTTKVWGSVVGFVAQYMVWLTVVFVIHTVFVQCTVQPTGKIICTYPLINSLFNFMVHLLSLILFTIIGLLLGGVLYKIIKDAMEAIGLEAELKKHNIVESLGNISLSSVLAGIVKWYVVLLFLTTGVQQFLSTIQIGENELLLDEFMVGLMNYIPKAVLGILVILASLILASVALDRIKYSGVVFARSVALAVEILIIFFGIVLALPNLFGIEDPDGEIFALSLSAMTDSFKILIAGLSLGLAIAMGLGLKDAVAKAGIKYEKEMRGHKEQ